jgi:hypothetical protein
MPAAYTLYAEIVPTLSRDFRRSAERQIKQALAGVKLEAKITAVPQVSKFFERDLNRQLKEKGVTGKVKVDVDKKGLTSAEGAVSRLTKSVNGSGGLIPSFISFGLTANGAMTALKVGALAASPLLISLGSSAFTASLSVAAIGSAAIGAGVGIATLAAAFSPATSAFKEYISTQDSALKKARKDNPFAGLNKSSAAFTKRLIKLNERWKSFQKKAADAVLPGVTDALTRLSTAPKGKKSLMDVLEKGALGLGKSLGNTAKSAGKVMDQPFFKGAMAKILEDNRKAFDRVGHAAVTLINPITRIFKGSSPLVVTFSKYVDKLATRFAEWVAGFKDGQIEGFFANTGHELAKWWKIFTDLAITVKNVFGASDSSGSNFVSWLGKLTGKMKDWTGSKEGQDRMRAFFDKVVKSVKDFDYISFGKMVAGVGAIAGTIKLVSALKGANPLLLLLAAVAQKYPKETADVLGKVAEGVGGLLKFAADHESLILPLTGLFLAMKGIQGIKIPSLKDLFTGKLTTPGGSMTNPMYVYVVNKGFRGGGIPSKALSIGSVIGAIAADGPAMVALGGLAAVLAVGIIGYNTPGAKAQRKQNKRDGVTLTNPLGIKAPAALRTAHGDSGNLNPRVNQQTPARRKTLTSFYNNASKVKALQDEARAMINLREATETTGQRQLVQNKVEADGFIPLQNYIKARKDSVTAAVAQKKATDGTAAAQKVATAETYKSRDSLATMLVSYGWNQDAAYNYAAQVYKIPKVAKTDVKTPGLKAAQTGFSLLKEKIDPVTGKKTITLSMGGDVKGVFTTLQSALIAQRALQSGLTISSAKQALQKDKDYDAWAKSHFHAGGWTGSGDTFEPAGIVHADEFVVRKNSRKKIEKRAPGLLDHMNQTGEVPGYKGGGSVSSWPFKDNIGKTKTKFPALGGGAGGPLGAAGVIPEWVQVAKENSSFGRNAGIGKWIFDTVNANGFHTSNHGMFNVRLTATGNKSMHGYGRAVDMDPNPAIFNWLRSNYGSKLKELIYSPAGGNQIYNGHNHMYSGITRAMHFNHIHAAYDQGGWMMPGHGGMNMGKKPEAVLTPAESSGLKAGLRGGGGGDTIIGGDTIVTFGDIHSDVDLQMAMDRIERLSGAGF